MSRRKQRRLPSGNLSQPPEQPPEQEPHVHLLPVDAEWCCPDAVAALPMDEFDHLQPAFVVEALPCWEAFSLDVISLTPDEREHAEAMTPVLSFGWVGGGDDEVHSLRFTMRSYAEWGLFIAQLSNTLAECLAHSEGLLDESEEDDE